MKLIYVSSPYAGDIERNTEFAKKACRHVMSEGHAFFVPHLLYPSILDDSQPQERQLGIDMGLAILKHCDELWCYGDRSSHGMMLEIEEAGRLGIPARRVLEQANGFVINKAIDDNTVISAPNQPPAFQPNHFEVKSKSYGNTGGYCMVGTVEFYLPELDKTLWVNCNHESASITTADYIWNSEWSESWEHHEDVCVASFSFDESPGQWKQWLPMVHEALAYTIEQEAAYFHQPFSLPVAWLPDTLKNNADPQYLDWLQAEGKHVEIAEQGRIVIDEAYPSSEQASSGIGTMGYQ